MDLTKILDHHEQRLKRAQALARIIPLLAEAGVSDPTHVGLCHMEWANGVAGGHMQAYGLVTMALPTPNVHDAATHNRDRSSIGFRIGSEWVAHAQIEDKEAMRSAIVTFAERLKKRQQERFGG